MSTVYPFAAGGRAMLSIAAAADLRKTSLKPELIWES
jgi:hypothetical protein